MLYRLIWLACILIFEPIESTKVQSFSHLKIDEKKSSRHRTVSHGHQSIRQHNIPLSGLAFFCLSLYKLNFSCISYKRKPFGNPLSQKLMWCRFQLQVLQHQAGSDYCSRNLSDQTRLNWTPAQGPLPEQPRNTSIVNRVVCCLCDLVFSLIKSPVRAGSQNYTMFNEIIKIIYILGNNRNRQN